MLIENVLDKGFVEVIDCLGTDLTVSVSPNGILIDNVASNIFSYRDQPLNNMIEYCYMLKSVYDEGSSES